MGQNLLVFQSLWAMERRHTDGYERPLEKNIEMIVESGYEGVSGDSRNRDYVRRLHSLMTPHGSRGGPVLSGDRGRPQARAGERC
ncbi:MULTISPECIES: hypothetical protein [Agrobacterium tumefaciens complex]|uniref:hypothetical protein n=1 Tax=Agrobacterium tumefaciens TaxID=358 RepID=UPI000FE3A9BD|nr:hypothetical protein [Agrobacterium tumefaciens]